MAGAGVRVRWVSFVGVFVALTLGASRIGTPVSLMGAGDSWRALDRQVGTISLGPLVLDGAWPLVAELGLLCAVVALVAAVAPASGASRGGDRG
ncbi:hypothetical protein GCM10009665_08080 [Kitasatospora nipponensis]|uniref:Uncharacterized protein n=1 Tax=Kitasatospora nipponensis TaxID=258049 RepID=A0ABP4GC17_9ACTN